MADDKQALLPCPFCAADAEFGDTGEGGTYIECVGCGASTNVRFSLMDDCRPLLVEQWNRRSLTGAGTTDNDGATFRLLVKLRMTLELCAGKATVRHEKLAEPVIVLFKAVDLGEYEGTRLAVLRAGAALRNDHE